MSLKDNNTANLTVSEALRFKKDRENTYRERALKLFPWICGHCGREFSGKRLRELTVHHKDHNHDNNPPDGSNWELLCIYCHDNEHSRDQVMTMRYLIFHRKKATAITRLPDWRI